MKDIESGRKPYCINDLSKIKLLGKYYGSYITKTLDIEIKKCTDINKET